MSIGRINCDGKKKKKEIKNNNHKTVFQPKVNQYNMTERGIYLPLEQSRKAEWRGLVLC